MPPSERPGAYDPEERTSLVDNDDPELERELARRRRQALAALERSGGGRRLWLPFAPLVAIAAVWLVLGRAPGPRVRSTVFPLHGYEVVLTGPSRPGFYRRLRFYRWLARHEESRS
jgi:hypothetical protein